MKKIIKEYIFRWRSDGDSERQITANIYTGKNAHEAWTSFIKKNGTQITLLEMHEV